VGVVPKAPQRLILNHPHPEPLPTRGRGTREISRAQEEKMILGIGTDLCDIRRIENSLDKYGERFTHRVFTEGERAKCDRRAARAPSYARRFAAKEACAKALGTGIGQGVFWRDMEVVNLPGGRPTLRLTGGAQEHLARMVPEGYEARLHITLTDEPPLAQAFVMIEAVPATPS